MVGGQPFSRFFIKNTEGVGYCLTNVLKCGSEQKGKQKP